MAGGLSVPARRGSFSTPQLEERSIEEWRRAWDGSTPELRHGLDVPLPGAVEAYSRVRSREELAKDLQTAAEAVNKLWWKYQMAQKQAEVAGRRTKEIQSELDASKKCCPRKRKCCVLL